MQIRYIWRAAALAVLAASSVASGAISIHWTTANISGDSDVNTQGTLVSAYSFGNTASPVVNGVTFQAAPLTFQQQQNDSTFVGNSFVLTNPQSLTATVFGHPPTLADGSAYASLTSSASYTLSNIPSMTLGVSLTTGHTYTIQLWVNDSRAGLLSQEPVGIDTLTVNADAPYPGGAGNGGQVLTGAFTATLSGILFNITTDAQAADFALINAVQLRDTTVPEPSLLALAGIGAAGVLVRRRSR